MSFYPDNIIICGENERAGHAGSEIKDTPGFLSSGTKESDSGSSGEYRIILVSLPQNDRMSTQDHSMNDYGFCLTVPGEVPLWGGQHLGTGSRL